MAGRKQAKGKCAYCGHETTKGGMAKHLSSCPERKKAISKAESRAGKGETLYHLRAQPAGGGEFWLDLEMRGSATLQDLDYYLREIWLECCGHMSQFSVGGWRGNEISLKKRIDEVFKPKTELTHIYDFGTSSETLIKTMGTREGKATSSRPIALMARNLMPEVECKECAQAATHICLECLYEGEDSWMLCAEHAEDHPHDEYGEPMPLVNSPRMGMCGYGGPAEPPY